MYLLAAEVKTIAQSTLQPKHMSRQGGSLASCMHITGVDRIPSVSNYTRFDFYRCIVVAMYVFRVLDIHYI